MKSEKILTLTKRDRFYTKVCKIYTMALKAKKEMEEISNLLADYEDAKKEKEIADEISMCLYLFTDTKYLMIHKNLSQIKLDKIALNDEKIKKAQEYIDKHTCNSDIF